MPNVPQLVPVAKLRKQAMAKMIAGRKFLNAPALFMTMVCSSYILIAPEGFHLPEAYRWIGYAVAGVVTAGLLALFARWTCKNQNNCPRA